MSVIDLMKSEGVAISPSKRLKEKAEWGETFLKAYYSYLRMARNIHISCDLAKIEAETSGDPEKIKKANENVRFITTAFFIEQERFLEQTKSLSVVVRHDSIGKDRKKIETEFIMPYSMASGEYMQELAKLNENIPEHDLIGSYVWYPTDFNNPKEFRYWQYRQFVDDERVEMLFEHEIEFLVDFEKEYFNKEAQTA